MATDPDKASPLFCVPRDGLRILFVDDDPILREFAVVNLSGDHATIDTAPDGAAALAAIEAGAPDVVLLDLEMPGLDGFKVLERLRAADATRALPVIVVSGREDVEAVERAFQAGATSFVVKPLNWRLLTHQLRYVLRMARAEREMAERREQTAAQLHRLALESTRFIAQALAHDPALRPTAVSFAKAADEVLGSAEAAEAA